MPWAIAGVGLLVIVVVLLVITVFDSNAVPWPLRFAPLHGLAFAVPAAVLQTPVPLVVGLALVMVGLGAQILWTRCLAGLARTVEAGTISVAAGVEIPAQPPAGLAISLRKD